MSPVVLLISVLFIFVPILANRHLSKRGVLELGLLIETHTHHPATKFIDYGNWCGLGGDRAWDGSVKDGCDSCCKNHDDCYSQLLYRTREFHFIHLKAPRRGLNLLSRACRPHTDGYSILPAVATRSSEYHPTLSCSLEKRFCSRRACICDILLVYCLQKLDQCSPAERQE